MFCFAYKFFFFFCCYFLFWPFAQAAEQNSRELHQNGLRNITNWTIDGAVVNISTSPQLTVWIWGAIVHCCELPSRTLMEFYFTLQQIIFAAAHHKNKWHLFWRVLPPNGWVCAPYSQLFLFFFFISFYLSFASVSIFNAIIPLDNDRWAWWGWWADGRLMGIVK